MEEAVKEIVFYCEFCSQRFDSLDHKPILLVPCVNIYNLNLLTFVLAENFIYFQGHSLCQSCYNCLQSTFCTYCKNEYNQACINWEIMKYLPQPAQSGSVKSELECELCLEHFDKFDKKPLVLVPCVILMLWFKRLKNTAFLCLKIYFIYLKGSYFVLSMFEWSAKCLLSILSINVWENFAQLANYRTHKQTIVHISKRFQSFDKISNKQLASFPRSFLYSQLNFAFTRNRFRAQVRLRIFL